MAFCEPAEVVSVTVVSPSFRRVRLRALGGWTWFVTGAGDERIDLLFPFPGQSHADVSYFNDERNGIHREDPAPPWRHYTVRAVHDGGREIDVDFVMHGTGVASDWAQQARAGDTVGVFRGSSVPRAYYAPPADAQWQLLIADATGMPGLARIVEELPDGVPVTAIVAAPTAEDRDYLPHTPQVTWIWVDDGDDAGNALASAVETIALPDGGGYAWAACESAAARDIRTRLRTVHGMARSAHRAVGYWTAGNAGHQEDE
ncbi:MAG: siderophore-interacting protein [Mycetocola sp.]